MRVVISGGSGLVGRALTDELVGAGHEAVVLSRRPKKVFGLPDRVSVRPWDGRTSEALTQELEGADAVVHLAGENIAAGRWTKARRERIRASRVESSAAVAEAIRLCSQRPTALLQASAVGYYGPRGDEETTETAPPGDDFLSSVCVAWESASAGVERLGVRRPVLRTGVVLSTAGGALPKMMLPFRLFAGGPVGSGRQWVPWIHIADEVGAIRFLLEHQTATGPYNLVAPGALTNREFSRLLGRVMERPSFLPTPGFALKVALGRMSTIVLDGQRALPEQLRADGFSFRFTEAEAALRDLLE